MKLTASLAYSQLKINRRRTVWTFAGIVFSAAMLTAVFGFAASGDAAFRVLRGDDYWNRDMYRNTIIGVAAFLAVIVVIASVVVVSNAFRVSAGERTAQFGILKSTGATKRQIARTVMYEGVWLSLAGIPAGIALGLLVEFIGLRIANYLLTGLNEISPMVKLVFPFIVSWQAVAIAFAVSFVTVLLSAWLPARKAARIAAIDAIRGAGEIKISRRQVRSGRLTRMLFGFEGTLAAKSLKRGRRNFRATVVSLSISIILFFTANGFARSVGQMTNMLYPYIDANIVGAYSSQVHSISGDDGEYAYIYESLDRPTADGITARLREYPETAVFGAGDNFFVYNTFIPPDMLTPKMRELCAPEIAPGQAGYEFCVRLVTADAEHYAGLCQKAGVPPGSNILINFRRIILNGKRTEFKPFTFSPQTLRLSHIDVPPLDLPLRGELTAGEIPEEILLNGDTDIVILVPELDALIYYWSVTAADKAGFIAYADAVLHEMIPQDGKVPVHIEVTDIEATSGAVRDMYRMIMVFIYGFVGMLILISLTNVISTISANVRSRSREFAVLQSAGMTRDGLKRMLNLESILCSARSLITGLPLGVAASYLVYRFVIASVDFVYDFPWLTVVECVSGVFLITWAVMRYSASRLRGGSIVEAIRAERGV